MARVRRLLRVSALILPCWPPALTTSSATHLHTRHQSTFLLAQARTKQTAQPLEEGSHQEPIDVDKFYNEDEEEEGEEEAEDDEEEDEEDAGEEEV